MLVFNVESHLNPVQIIVIFKGFFVPKLEYLE